MYVRIWHGIYNLLNIKYGDQSFHIFMAIPWTIYWIELQQNKITVDTPTQKKVNIFFQVWYDVKTHVFV